MTTFKAAVRSVALKSLSSSHSSIGAAESHAKRIDPVAQKRRIRESDPLAWSKGGEPLDYVEAFKNHKREFGASERANSGLAMEFKIVVSPDWLKETGSAHDENNLRVKQLYDEALKWAESWGGSGSVWGLRYDTDEKGSGVVDVFMSPIREQKHKSGKSKNVISCRKAKEELLAAEKLIEPSLRTSGAAMQSSWARWCQENLDQRIVRGVSKEETQTEHIHADLYAKVAEETRQVFEDHLFPDPFAPPRPPTPEEARLLAKLEAVKEEAIKKASSEARRAEQGKIAEQAAKLKEATQRANMREVELSERIKSYEQQEIKYLTSINRFEDEKRRILSDLREKSHAFNMSLRRAVMLEDLILRPVQFLDVFRELKSPLGPLNPIHKNETIEEIKASGGAYKFIRSLYSDPSEKTDAEIKKIFDDVLRPFKNMAVEAVKTKQPNFSNDRFSVLLERFGQVSRQETLLAITVEATKKVYANAELGSFSNDRYTPEGAKKLVTIGFAIGNILSSHIIKFLDTTFQSIKDHTQVLLHIKAVKEELELGTYD